MPFRPAEKESLMKAENIPHIAPAPLAEGMDWIFTRRLITVIEAAAQRWLPEPPLSNATR